MAVWGGTKLDWDQDDVVDSGQFNRQEGNTQYLYDQKQVIDNSFQLSSYVRRSWTILTNVYLATDDSYLLYTTGVRVPNGHKIVLERAQYQVNDIGLSIYVTAGSGSWTSDPSHPDQWFAYNDLVVDYNLHSNTSGSDEIVGASVNVYNTQVSTLEFTNCGYNIKFKVVEI